MQWRGQARIVLGALMLSGMVSSAAAGDFLSGTYLDPAMQRKDIFSHRVWNAWPEYRATYNRPRYVGGHIAHIVEPTSQEAMAWKINKENGNYANHCGRYVPLYYYPKPWEALNTRARPDFVTRDELASEK
ncbi:hypothetical protein SH467x_003901 [Pirellulaceae bacterium SH467]